MAGTLLPNNYPHTLARESLVITSDASLVATPISDPDTDPRVNTAAAVSAAFAAAEAKTLELWHGERLVIKETLEVPYDGQLICHGDAAVVVCADADEAVIGVKIGQEGQLYGITGSAETPKESRVRVKRYIQSDWSDNVNDIGVQIWNAYRSHVVIVGSDGFGCALEIASDDSTAYSQFGVGHLLNAQVGLRLKNWAALDGGGVVVFCNANKFYRYHGGRIGCNSGVNVSMSRYGIVFTRDQSGDSEFIDYNEFEMTIELNAGVLTGGAEAVAFVHEVGKENIFRYYDENTTLLFRWSGETRLHQYWPIRNDDRRQQGEYLGTYAGARVFRRDRNMANFGTYVYESPDWGQPGNHVISHESDDGDSLWLAGAGHLTSSGGTIFAVGNSATSGNYSIANGFPKSTNNDRAWGVMLSTRQGKEFFLDRDSDRTVNNGGRFLYLCFDKDGNQIGGRSIVSGSFTECADSSGFCQFTEAAHAVQQWDVLEITDSSVGAYERDQGPNAVTSVGVSGGQVVLTTGAAHGLVAGDWVRLYSTSLATHNRWHRVHSTPTSSTAILDSDVVGSSTGGYLVAKRYHIVTARDSNTFTTNRAFVSDGTGDYSTVSLVKNGGRSGSTITPTTSWGRGYTYGSDFLEPRHVRFHDLVDRVFVATHRAPTRQITIASTDDVPVVVSPGHGYPPYQPLGYSPPQWGSYGLGAYIHKVNRGTGTGAIEVGWSCSVAGSASGSGFAGTWQSHTATMAAYP